VGVIEKEIKYFRGVNGCKIREQINRIVNVYDVHFTGAFGRRNCK
jgi:hypothetical protein